MATPKFDKKFVNKAGTAAALGAFASGGKVKGFGSAAGLGIVLANAEKIKPLVQGADAAYDLSRKMHTDFRNDVKKDIKTGAKLVKKAFKKVKNAKKSKKQDSGNYERKPGNDPGKVGE